MSLIGKKNLFHKLHRRQLWDAKVLCVHPNENTATLQLRNVDFRKFIVATVTEIRLIELPYIDNDE